MPVHSVKGQPNCYQWGNTGKIYCGNGAKEKAERQGRAIHASGWKEAESNNPKYITIKELEVGDIFIFKTDNKDKAWERFVLKSKQEVEWRGDGLSIWEIVFDPFAPSPISDINAVIKSDERLYRWINPYELMMRKRFGLNSETFEAPTPQYDMILKTVIDLIDGQGYESVDWTEISRILGITHKKIIGAVAIMKSKYMIPDSYSSSYDSFWIRYANKTLFIRWAGNDPVFYPTNHKLAIADLKGKSYNRNVKTKNRMKGILRKRSETFEARGENKEHWIHHECVFCDYKTEPKWLRLRKDKRCPKCAVNREFSENNKFMIPTTNVGMSLFSPQAKLNHFQNHRAAYTEEEIEALWEEKKERFRNMALGQKMDWEEIDKNKEFRAESSKPHSVTISRSSNSEKKLMAVFEDSDDKKIKTTHFGQRGASDYTKHGEKERMKRYLERHGGGTTTSTKEDWNDPKTAGSLSRWVLWNKPNLKSSFNDYKSRFGLKGELKVSKSAETFETKSPAQKSLNKWTKEDWGTKSGKPSTQGKTATGERYLPAKAIDSLTDKEYARTSAKKRQDTKKGKQFSDQPDDIEEKVAKYRAETDLESRIKFKAIEGTGSNARFTDQPDSKVYRDPSLRQKARNSLLKGTKGGEAGQWSARKAQGAAKEYRSLYENKHGDGKNPYFAEMEIGQLGLNRFEVFSGNSVDAVQLFDRPFGKYKVKFDCSCNNFIFTKLQLRKPCKHIDFVIKTLKFRGLSDSERKQMLRLIHLGDKTTLDEYGFKNRQEGLEYIMKNEPIRRDN